MNERLSLSAFIITFGQKGQSFCLTFLMYIYQIKQISYMSSLPYKEEYIYIITNSLFALIFLTEVTYNGIY